MSDESSRSARPSGQRRNDGAPAWWSALERADLPEDQGVPAAHRRWYEGDTAGAPPPEVVKASAPRRVRPAWVINTLVFLAIALMLMVALGGVVGSAGDMLLTISLVIGVPALLVVITTVVVARRSR
jgi:hypothetical protein